MTNELGLDALELEVAIIKAELICGMEKFGNYASTHEALGVILEEFEEFKEEIKNNNTAGAVCEARQLAAVAMRFCVEFGDEEGEA